MSKKCIIIIFFLVIPLSALGVGVKPIQEGCCRLAELFVFMSNDRWKNKGPIGKENGHRTAVGTTNRARTDHIWLARALN
jgi:hypothetical protein